MAIHNRDSVEFYDGAHLIAQAWSSMVPPVGAKISIRKKVWTVHKLTYALNQANIQHYRGMLSNVYVFFYS